VFVPRSHPPETRERARELRSQGRAIKTIARELRIAQSTAQSHGSQTSRSRRSSDGASTSSPIANAQGS
jgi:transposase-like protein